MEKNKKILIIIAAITIILATIIIVSVTVGPMLFMTPSETEKFSNSNIHILKDNINNVYIINSSDGYIVIDAGYDLKTVQDELKHLNINTSDVKHIFLTHSDYDHADGISLFKNAKVYVSEDMLEINESKIISFERNSLDNAINIDNVILLGNEELEIGDVKIKSIKTPGHTPGHMVFLIDDKYLFTGDALEISENKLKIHPFTMDEKKASESIKIIKEIIKDITKHEGYVFTAHYGHYKAQNLNLN